MLNTFSRNCNLKVLGRRLLQFREMSRGRQACLRLPALPTGRQAVGWGEGLQFIETGRTPQEVCDYFGKILQDNRRGEGRPLESSQEVERVFG